jgi:hypothetical protein
MTFMRNGLLAVVVSLLLSCGGGGGGGGGGTASLAGVSGVAGGTFSDARTEGAAGGDAASSGGSSSAGSATTTAATGDNGSGVGSGGTGVTTADAVGIGAVDGLGSIIVNGLRYSTDAATLRIDDAPSLQIGMTVKVTGSVNADFTSGVARLVESAADLRGPASSIDTAAGSFAILGTTVTTDASTVWADSTGLAGIAGGTTLQVWGLPASPGVLRATRVEQRIAVTLPIVTGTVQGLNAGLRSFTLGGLNVDYGAALLAGAVDPNALVNGTIVRVRAAGQPVLGRLAVNLVEVWNPLPATRVFPLQLAGVVTDHAALGSFRVLGTRVDASQARITGGPATSVGNGVKVEVDGIYSNGVLGASKLRIRHVPGTGGPASFNVIGPIGNFVSAASFRVRGQPVNAGGPGVVFVNGSASQLSNGARVNVSGSQIVEGVLIADRVSFE